MFAASNDIEAVTDPDIAPVSEVTKPLEPVIFTPAATPKPATPEPAIEVLTQAATLPVQDASDAKHSKQEHSGPEHSEPEQPEKRNVKEKQTEVKPTIEPTSKKSKPAPSNDQFNLF